MTKSKILNIHIYLLSFILLHFGFQILTGYGLNQSVIFVVKLILYSSGIIMFFMNIRPFKLISIYFSFYAISGIVVAMFFLFGGIILAVFSSILLYPIYPKQVEFENQSIKVYHRFQGFLSHCCSYEVTEPKLYPFEKHLGFIEIETEIKPKKTELKLNNGKIIYKHEVENYNIENKTSIKVDTIEIKPN